MRNPYNFVGVVLLLIVGVVLSSKGILRMGQGINSNSWPSTEGKIIFSGIANTEQYDVTTFKVEVHYQYVVKDITYVSKKIRLGFEGFTTSSSERIYKFSEKYPQDKTVTVYFDPKNAQNSVLEPGLFTHQFVSSLGLGIVLLCIGLRQLYSLVNPKVRKGRLNIRKRPNSITVISWISIAFGILFTMDLLDTLFHPEKIVWRNLVVTFFWATLPLISGSAILRGLNWGRFVFIIFSLFLIVSFSISSIQKSGVLANISIIIVLSAILTYSIVILFRPTESYFFEVKGRTNK